MKEYKFANGRTDYLTSVLLDQINAGPKSSDENYIQGWIDRSESIVKYCCVVSRITSQLRQAIIDDVHVNETMINSWIREADEVRKNISTERGILRNHIHELCMHGAERCFIKKYFCNNGKISDDELEEWLRAEFPDGEEQRMEIVKKQLYKAYVEIDSEALDEIHCSEIYGITIPEMYSFFSDAEIEFQRSLLAGTSISTAEHIALRMADKFYCREFIIEVISASGLSEKQIDDCIKSRYVFRSIEEQKAGIRHEIQHKCSNAINNGTRFLADLCSRMYGVSRSEIDQIELHVLKSMNTGIAEESTVSCETEKSLEEFIISFRNKGADPILTRKYLKKEHDVSYAEADNLIVKYWNSITENRPCYQKI